jgi:hypothetical protein
MRDSLGLAWMLLKVANSPGFLPVDSKLPFYVLIKRITSQVLGCLFSLSDFMLILLYGGHIVFAFLVYL